MTPAEMVEKYLQIREHEDRAQAEFKESMKRVVEAKKKLEGMMLAHLQETGAEHIGCAAGTVYKLTKYSATVQDRKAFLDWVVEQDEWDALDAKANMTYAKEAFTNGTVVPGVNLSSFTTVGVRRS